MLNKFCILALPKRIGKFQRKQKGEKKTLTTLLKFWWHFGFLVIKIIIKIFVQHVRCLIVIWVGVVLLKRTIVIEIIDLKSLLSVPSVGQEKEGLEVNIEKGKDVGHGRWICGHSPRCREDPKTRKAKRSWAPKNSRAQNQVSLWKRPAWSPPIWVKYFWGLSLKPNFWSSLCACTSASSIWGVY